MPLAHCTLVDVPRATSNSNPRNEAPGLSGSVPELSSRPPEPRLFSPSNGQLLTLKRSIDVRFLNAIDYRRTTSNCVRFEGMDNSEFYRTGKRSRRVLEGNCASLSYRSIYSKGEAVEWNFHESCSSQFLLFLGGSAFPYICKRRWRRG